MPAPYYKNIRRLAFGLLVSSSLCALAAPSDLVQVVSRIDPEFPREATQAGADKGRVKARMTISGSGEVTRVEIVEATPRRLFDRAVVKTLSQWKFNNGNDGRQYDIDVDFHR
jgi:periplasmic protein TonB